MAIPKPKGRARGPIPKRSTERRRRNIDSRPSLVSLPVGAVSVRDPDPNWHPVIQEFYASLQASPQAELYTSSDWGLIRLLCFRESLNLKGGRPSAMMTGIFLGQLPDLLVTEGARRRLRVELTHEPQPEPPSVAIMRRYREQLIR